ncbi:hypothetical protein BB559_001174 [Furculomyces boomerangus]|uniref:Pseudouridine synthase RsuA/RluA-like domain-containing protein n=1 Tax=Furculomyces boomerangus TaxID=61424 RepID=A0A2T9Z2Y9_9FUNG|nr:hypothetical protein BB559_001174 [Furculomyces boomerangus]
MIQCFRRNSFFGSSRQLSNKTTKFIVATSHDENMRIDRFVHKKLGIPVSLAQRMFREGKFWVEQSGLEESKIKAIKNSLRIKPSMKIYYPESIQENIFGIQNDSVKNFGSNTNLLPIIYEDEAIIVFSKPNGLATQGGTKVNISVDHIIKEYENKTLRLVHRLDKDTSGLLVVAKTRLVAKTLTELFKTHKVGKKYLAIVVGHPIPEIGTINKPLAKGISKGKETTVLASSQQEESEKEQEAITFYKTVSKSVHSNCPVSIVELYPSTGRKHQLRVHLASVLKCPILGDKKYNDVDNALGVFGKKKMYLHMQKIKIPLLDEYGNPKLVNGEMKQVVLSTNVPVFWKQTMNSLNLSFR